MATAVRQLVTLAWPIVLARSAQSVIGFTDAAMVAPLGDDALAAATTGAVNVFGAFSLPLGVVFIVQSFAAQLGGRGDLAGARRYVVYGLWLAAITAVLSVLALPAIGPALALTGHAPAVQEAMREYMAIRLLGAGLVVANEALGAWFAGLGDTQVAMRSSLVAMVVNIFLNWVLIYGHLGAPALGVAGAAWASVAATVAGLAVSVLAYAKDRGAGAMARLQASQQDGTAPPPEPGLPVPEDSDRPRLREFGRMLRFGLPSGFNWFLEFSAFIAFVNFIFADLGTVPVAALMAVVQVNSVSFMPAFGLASAGAVLVGQAIGRERRDEVPAVVRLTFAAAATWQGLVGLSYLVFPTAMMSLFSRDLDGHPAVQALLAATPAAGDVLWGPLALVAAPVPAALTLASLHVAEGEVAALGASLLAISAAWQLLDATAMTLSEALRAAGDTAWTLYARVLLAWAVWIPLALFVVQRGGGAAGAMWATVAYMVALAVAFVLRFRNGAWRRIDLTGHAGGH